MIVKTNFISVEAEAAVVVVAEDSAIAIDLPHEEDLEVLHDTTVTVVHDHAVDKFSKTAMFSLIFAKIEFFRFSFSPSSVKFRVVSISNCFRSPAWSRYSCSKKTGNIFYAFCHITVCRNKN